MSESWFGFLIFLWIVLAPTIGFGLIGRGGSGPIRNDREPVSRV
jgi:hypothetical protein